MKKIIFLLILFLMNDFVFAQGEGAVPFLTLQQSTLLNGAGWIGTAIPNNDAIGFYYNPAILGYQSRINHASIFLMPAKYEWMKNIYSHPTINSFGVNVGYKFKNDSSSLPITLGIGYIRNVFDFGTFVQTGTGSTTPTTFESKDSFHSFSVGASLEYYCLFNAGFSIKPFFSKLGAGTAANPNFGEASGTAFDFGVLVIAPVSKLFFDEYTLDIGNGSYFKPDVNFSIGYSLTNVGKEINYGDPLQSDPISRTARLGYSFNLGCDLSIKGCIIKAVEYSFTAEAQDILITGDSTGLKEYQGLLGDINIGRHLINLKPDYDATVHKGHIFRFFETITITSGRFTGHGYSYNVKTNGFGISSDGIFKLLSIAADDPAIQYISNHFVIEYNKATIFADTKSETELSGITLTYRNFEL